MNRHELESYLVNDDIDYILSTKDGKDLLREILYNGFAGYTCMTEHDLTNEYKSRQIK